MFSDTPERRHIGECAICGRKIYNTDDHYNTGTERFCDDYICIHEFLKREGWHRDGAQAGASWTN